MHEFRTKSSYLKLAKLFKPTLATETMKIPITFLGTGQAVPTSKRNHTSILINYKSEAILIDCGEGTQRQFRKAKLNPCKLTKILITHWHGDHILGIPGLLQTLALNNYNRKLQIYIPQGTKHYLDAIFRIFAFVGKINLEVKECSPGTIFENQDYKIECEEMSHGTPCLAYSIIEKEKIRIDKVKLKKYKLKGKIIGELQKGKDIEFNGKKIKAKSLIYIQPGKKITFILDTVLNDNMAKIAKDSDLLVCESSYTKEEENLAKEYKHLTAEQVASVAKKAKVKKLVLTHLSQRYESREKIVLNEAKKTFKNVIIAEDLMKLEV